MGLTRIAGTVGVVLVNWNGAEHTVPCIESLLAGSVVPHRIVVVDNASDDDSANRIAERFKDITLIRNTENLGFTGANNIGINTLMGLGCDYIWILNNDTTVDKQCLSVLKGYLDTHVGAAACSGKILYAEPHNMIWYAGATYNRWTVQSTHRGQGEIDVGQYERVEEVPFVSGCCMFMRRDAIERIGLFDDRFFAYYEDSDWCLRAMEAKQHMHYVPLAIISHKVSATVNRVRTPGTPGTTSRFSIYITNRNRLFMIRKHATGSVHKFTAVLGYAFWILYYGTALLLLGRLEKLKALVMSARDGILQPLSASESTRRKPRYLP